MAGRGPPRPGWGPTGWALPWDGLEPEPRAPGGPGGAQDRWSWASLWQGANGAGSLRAWPSGAQKSLEVSGSVSLRSEMGSPPSTTPWVWAGGPWAAPVGFLQADKAQLVSTGVLHRPSERSWLRGGWAGDHGLSLVQGSLVLGPPTLRLPPWQRVFYSAGLYWGPSLPLVRPWLQPLLLRGTRPPVNLRAAFRRHLAGEPSAPAGPGRSLCVMPLAPLNRLACPQAASPAVWAGHSMNRGEKEAGVPLSTLTVPREPGGMWMPWRTLPSARPSAGADGRPWAGPQRCWVCLPWMASARRDPL